MQTLTLDAVFSRLDDDAETDAELYTTLAPLYRAMYVARGRIDGQLAAVDAATPPDATTVLELGCGTGHLLDRLTPRFRTVVGADVSPTMARLASERAPYVCQADARGIATDSVDVAALLGAVLGHIRPDTAARETVSSLYRVLRPGGRVVCSVHRHLTDARSRELTRSVDGYEITQHDEQRPIGDTDTFEWAVGFEMTDEATGETRSASVTTMLRAFTPAELIQWFEDAGFTAVSTRPRNYVDGPGETDRAFLLTGECPRTDRPRQS